jgi:hypothetical protein
LSQHLHAEAEKIHRNFSVNIVDIKLQSSINLPENGVYRAHSIVIEMRSEGWDMTCASLESHVCRQKYTTHTCFPIDVYF